MKTVTTEDGRSIQVEEERLVDLSEIDNEDDYEIVYVTERRSIRLPFVLPFFGIF